MATMEFLKRRFAERSVRKESGCLEWTGAKNQYGYGVIGNAPKSNLLTHRLAWMIANGGIPDGLCVLHHCDNPPCGEISHLFLGTRADNCVDKIRKGRARWGQRDMRGELSPWSKLTAEKILEIRKATGPQTEIAKQFGIAQQHVSDIKRLRRWSHVNGNGH